jgi:O-antigen/teichoic acid export membrane protein
MGTSLAIRASGMLMAAILLVGTTHFTVEEPLTKIMVYLIFLGSSFQMFQVFEYRFRADLHSKQAAYANSMVVIASAILKLYFIYTQKPLIYFATTTLVEGITYFALYFYFYKKIYGKSIRPWQIDFSFWNEVAHQVWPMAAGALFISLYSRIDQVMIMEMLGPAQVGQYYAATRLTEAWAIIPVTISYSLFPAIVEAKDKDQDLYEKRLKKTYGILFWISFGMGVVLTFFGDFITSVLFGSDFDQAGGVLAISAWTVMFSTFSIARYRWLILENIQHFGLLFQILGAVANIVLNLLLIPRFGIEGAASASLIAQVLIALVIPSFIMQSRSSVGMFFRAMSLGQWIRQ